MRQRLLAAAAAAFLLAIGGAAVPLSTISAAAAEDESPGTPGYFVKSAREYLAAKNWALAESNARIALGIDASHAGAKAVIAQAQAGKAAQAAASAPRGEDVSPGTPGYFVKAGREHLEARNWTLAESNARIALGIDPSHGGALALLEEAQRGKAARPALAAGAAPVAGPVAPVAPPAPPVAQTAGDPNAIGTPAYFMRYARMHVENKNWSGAERYAKETLAVDPVNAEARRILATAQAEAAKPQPKPTGSAAARELCEQQYSTCYSSARTFTPGGSYSFDYAGQAQCMTRRNICLGAAN